MGTKPIPKRSDLVDFNYAVAGHAGTLCDPDGELFIKPCTKQEIDFYNSVQDDHRAFGDLMPLYMGTLLLNDATTVEDINEQLPVIADHIPLEMKEEVVALAHQVQPKMPEVADNITWLPNKDRKIATDTALVLENTAYGFKRPNIMDCKLGQRLWADDAPLEKRKKFDKIRRDTTHENLGFRIAGMRVYKGSDNPEELDPEDYRIYDKNWGRFDVNDQNIVKSFRKFIFNPAAGISEEYGKAVAQAFSRDLERVREVLESERSRMYSSSLLFVFEGDGEALRAAIESSNAELEKLSIVSKDDDISGRSTIRVDSGIDLDEDGELITGAGQEEDEDLFDEVTLPKIYSLKLIDFAHAQWVSDEEGPDENILLGVRSLIKIFDEMSE